MEEASHGPAAAHPSATKFSFPDLPLDEHQHQEYLSLILKETAPLSGKDSSPSHPLFRSRGSGTGAGAGEEGLNSSVYGVMYGGVPGTPGAHRESARVSRMSGSLEALQHKLKSRMRRGAAGGTPVPGTPTDASNLSPGTGTATGTGSGSGLGMGKGTGSKGSNRGRARPAASGPVIMTSGYSSDASNRKDSEASALQHSVIDDSTSEDEFAKVPKGTTRGAQGAGIALGLGLGRARGDEGAHSKEASQLWSSSGQNLNSMPKSTSVTGHVFGTGAGEGDSVLGADTDPGSASTPSSAASPALPLPPGFVPRSVSLDLPPESLVGTAKREGTLGDGEVDAGASALEGRGEDEAEKGKTGEKEKEREGESVRARRKGARPGLSLTSLLPFSHPQPLLVPSHSVSSSSSSSSGLWERRNPIFAKAGAGAGSGAGAAAGGGAGKGGGEGKKEKAGAGKKKNTGVGVSAGAEAGVGAEGSAAGVPGPQWKVGGASKKKGASGIPTGDPSADAKKPELQGLSEGAKALLGLSFMDDSEEEEGDEEDAGAFGEHGEYEIRPSAEKEGGGGRSKATTGEAGEGAGLGGSLGAKGSLQKARASSLNAAFFRNPDMSPHGDSVSSKGSNGHRDPRREPQRLSSHKEEVDSAAVALEVAIEDLLEFESQGSLRMRGGYTAGTQAESDGGHHPSDPTAQAEAQSQSPSQAQAETGAESQWHPGSQPQTQAQSQFSELTGLASERALQSQEQSQSDSRGEPQAQDQGQGRLAPPPGERRTRTLPDPSSPSPSLSSPFSSFVSRHPDSASLDPSLSIGSILEAVLSASDTEDRGTRGGREPGKGVLKGRKARAGGGKGKGKKGAAPEESVPREMYPDALQAENGLRSLQRTAQQDKGEGEGEGEREGEGNGGREGEGEGEGDGEDLHKVGSADSDEFRDAFEKQKCVVHRGQAPSPTAGQQQGPSSARASRAGSRTQADVHKGGGSGFRSSSRGMRLVVGDAIEEGEEEEEEEAGRGEGEGSVAREGKAVSDQAIASEAEQVSTAEHTRGSGVTLSGDPSQESQPPPPPPRVSPRLSLHIPTEPEAQGATEIASDLHSRGTEATSGGAEQEGEGGAGELVSGVAREGFRAGRAVEYDEDGFIIGPRERPEVEDTDPWHTHGTGAYGDSWHNQGQLSPEEPVQTLKQRVTESGGGKGGRGVSVAQALRLGIDLDEGEEGEEDFGDVKQFDDFGDSEEGEGGDEEGEDGAGGGGGVGGEGEAHGEGGGGQGKAEGGREGGEGIADGEGKRGKGTKKKGSKGSKKDAKNSKGGPLPGMPTFGRALVRKISSESEKEPKKDKDKSKAKAKEGPRRKKERDGEKAAEKERTREGERERGGGEERDRDEEGREVPPVHHGPTRGEIPYTSSYGSHDSDPDASLPLDTSASARSGSSQLTSPEAGAESAPQQGAGAFADGPKEGDVDGGSVGAGRRPFALRIASKVWAQQGYTGFRVYGCFPLARPPPSPS